MTLKQYFKRALSLSPRVVLIKALQLALRLLKSYFIETKDFILPTYSTPKSDVIRFQKIYSTTPQIDDLNSFSRLPELIELTLQHKFDLLGSGWTSYSHKAAATSINQVVLKSSVQSDPLIDKSLQFINRSNRKYAQSVRSMISTEYVPIDWHRDIKSGYRWMPSTWWLRIPYGHLLGVDIKMPWELSRCHHLTWLALGHISEKNIAQKDILRKEYVHQVLDFISTNPPRFGVNWRCPMDIAIRSANWILAYDWFSQSGAAFDQEFNQMLAAYLEDQGDFIFKNLEIGSDKFRGNHYLADICGLSFIAFFLPESEKTQNWKSFCHQALIEEMDYQFFSDGSNFEGSTSYHRLSSEMVFYTFILFQNESTNYPFNDDFKKRIKGFSEFSKNIHFNLNEIVQIGDCDSGRFFKIQPLFTNDDVQFENHLTHQCLIQTIDSYFQTTSEKSFELLEALWMKRLSNKSYESTNTATSTWNLNSYTGNHGDKIKTVMTLVRQSSTTQELTSLINQQIGDAQITSVTIPVSRDDLNFISYPEFGLFIWKNNQTFFSFRAGKVGQKERGGHDHNDQLSIVFIENNQHIFADPGTGIYTPFPDIRNKYRCSEAHAGPALFHKGVRLESGSLDQGLFSLNSKQSSDIVTSDKNITAAYNNIMNTLRAVRYNQPKKEFWVVDICFSKNFELRPMNQASLNYSRGYGYF